MDRIYFDTNDRLEDGRYWLGIPGSAPDLARIADKLHDGLRVVIYMTAELEMEATLELDPAWGWVARGDHKTLRFYSDESR